MEYFFLFLRNKNEIKKLYGEYETIVDAAGNTITKERMMWTTNGS